MSTFSQFLSTGGMSSTAPNAPFPGYGSAQYYFPTVACLFTSNGRSMTANRLYATPFFCRVSHTFSQMAITQSAASPTGNVLLGIYSDQNGLPGSKLLEFTPLVFSGSTGIRTVTDTISLTGGTWYWLAAVADAALGVVGFDNATPSFLGVGAMIQDHGLPTAYTTTLDLAANVDVYAPIYGSHTYGTLPSPFPAIAGSSVQGPILALKG